MEQFSYLLERMAALMNIGIFQMEQENLVSFKDYVESNPINCSANLRNLLKKGADAQEQPYIFRDQFGIFFACVRKEETYYMLGPMNINLSAWTELRQYYKYYGIAEASEKKIKCLTLSEVLDIVEVVAALILQKEYTDEELLYMNGIISDTRVLERREQIVFDMKEGEEERYHHTYQEERKLLDSIREGSTEKALQYSRNMDAALGRLSEKELNHWKNVVIAAITLCTRAGIDSGILPPIC